MMKGYKGPLDSSWKKGGEYGWDDEKRKRAGILRILAGLVVLVIVVGGCFLFFRKPSPVESEKDQNGLAVINEDISLEAPPQKERIRRRNIYDRYLTELAISFKVDSIYVKPLEFDNIEKTVALLADTLNLDEKDVLDELKTQRSYKWVVKNISPEKAAKVAALNLPGVYFYEQEQRFNPSRANMGQIIGEVKEGRGLSGIELFYESLLLGNSAEVGPAGGNGMGKSLVLTLDARMQLMLEQEMTALLHEIRPNEQAADAMTAVSALLMDADRGEVLASVRLPFFAPTKLEEPNSIAGTDRMVAGHVDPGVLSLIFKAAANFDQVQSVPEKAPEPVETIKSLVPRMAKKIREGPEKSPWVLLEDGSYVSDWLADAMKVETAATENNQVDFSDFGKILARSGESRLDLPGENGGRETGIGLLCGYAALVNGGNRVTPHILKAILSDKGEQEEWPWPQQENKVIGPDASRALVLFLHEKTHPAPFLVGEVLRPHADLAVTEDETAMPAADNIAPSGAAGPEEKPVTRVARHCEGLVLASAPIDKPELVMLLVVDDATVDLMQASPLRRHADAFLQAALKWHHQKKEIVRASAESISREEIFQRWMLRNKQLGFDLQEGKKEDPDIMIDVRGLSIRKALQDLDRFNVKVVIDGSGVVKKQLPEPGGKVKEGTLVILKAETKR